MIFDTISVIIITKNRSRLLKRCINSIYNSSKLPDEIIIIDNNSTDNTKLICTELKNKYKKKYKKNYTIIKYIFNKKGGISESRNLGLKLGKKKIIAFTDDDCIVNKYWIENIIKSHNIYNHVAIGGNTLNYGKNIIQYSGHLFRRWSTFESIHGFRNLSSINIEFELNKIQKVRTLATQNISYKKKYIKNIIFNNNLAVCEAVDYSWKITNKFKTPILYIPDIIVYHEYRTLLKEFFYQQYQYGFYYQKLIRIAKEKSYVSIEKINRIRYYLKYFIFSCYESFNNKFYFLNKFSLLFIMLLRPLIFRLGYLNGYFKKQ